MRWLPVIFLAVFTAGCGEPNEPGARSGPRTAADDLTPIEGLSRYALAEPISEGNMSIVPIVLADAIRLPPDPGRMGASAPEVQVERHDYVTLAEAKRNGWIEIHELEGGGDVPRVEVLNKGEKPILLLAGDLLLGGQQDRVVAKDTIVPPGKTVQVTVFCVEPGRWTGSTRFEGAEAQVPQSVAYEAKFGRQESVWGSVGEYNEKARSASGLPLDSSRWRDSSSVRKGIGLDQVKERIDRDLPAFLEALKKRKTAVGFVVVLNGDVLAAELFGSPELLEAAAPSLLRGFIADAAVAKTDRAGSVALADCKAFLKDIMAGDRRQTHVAGNVGGWRVDRGDLAGAETTLPGASNSSPAVLAGRDGEGGQFIRGSYSKKK